MNFDARRSHTPEERHAYTEWLIEETAGALRRSGSDHESLKASVFLAMNRARESGLSDGEVAEVLGVSIARSGMDDDRELGSRFCGWIRLVDQGGLRRTTFEEVVVEIREVS